MEIPFNMNFKISAEDLREIPEDYNQMRQGVEHLQKTIDNEIEPKKKAVYLSKMGVYQRILLDLDQSENSLQQSLDIFKNLKAIPQAVGVKLRLAITLQWKEKYGAADEIFHDLIGKIIKSKDERLRHFLDFAYQHYGKSKFEQKQYNEASKNFLAALDLRLEKGDMELIESTQVAINQVRSRLND